MTEQSRYRIVHFVPDPFLGTRVPIAALVQERGKVHFLRVPNIPGPQCLGSRERAAVVNLMLEDLAECDSFERLPGSIGSHASLDNPVAVPSETDATDWVRAHVLERYKGTQKPAHALKLPRRATEGFRFLELHGLREWVEKRFDPASDEGGRLSAARALGPINHYVRGRDELLLMEPLVAARERAADDVSEVCKLFGSYKKMVGSLVEPKPRFVAYVLAGGAPAARTRFIDDLSSYADEVVDTADRVQRGHFIEQVRSVGGSRFASSSLL